MCKKLTFLLTVTLIMLGLSSGIQAQTTAYVYHGGVGSYGTLDLSTGAFTTINMGIQGSYFALSADNDGIDGQYVAMSNYSLTSFFLAHMNFTTQTQDSIGPLAPLAAGQTQIKAFAHNSSTDVWYAISGDDFGSAAALYTVDINTGALTLVGTIQNAAAPITLAIDCDGNAYFVNVEGLFTTIGVLYSLDLTTAAATPIGTGLGLDGVTFGSQDMDFNPEDGSLYWTGYWSSGFFSEGGSFRSIDVTNGTSTEIAAFGQFETLTAFNVNAVCQSAQTTAYVYHGGVGSYGTLDLSTGAFTTINMGIQGSYFALSADNDGIDGQYVAMSNYSLTSFFLAHMNFTTQTQDSIGPLAPLAAGQTQIKAFAHNSGTDVWYAISGDDFGSAAALYTVDINTGALTLVGTIQNAAAPITLAIDCDGNAYFVNVEGLFTTIGVLYSLDLTTAAATPIGTGLGLDGVTFGSQDMDFNPEDGSLYWTGYWSSGFFSEGGSFRSVDVTNGTSTEIAAFGQFETLTAFNVNAVCATIPVELTSFSANVSDGAVVLNWYTATELNNSGFEVERKSQNTDWARIAFVPGSGTTTEGRNYSYSDNSITSGTYTYRLRQVDFDGSFEYSQEVNVDVTPTMDYALQQNYPNPFNPSTKIRFTVPEASVVKLAVFNAIGEEIKELVNNYYTAGSHEIIFNASNLSSGIYFVKMESGSFVSTRKMTLLK